MAQEPLQLRPMTVADIIDASIRIYRHNFGPILGISAIVQLPIMLCSIVAGAVMMRMGLMGAPMGQTPQVDPEVLFNQMGPEMLVASAVVLLAMAAYAILYPLGEAALAIGVSERYLGREIRVGDCYRAAMPFWWGVLGTTILCWLAAYGVLIGGLFVIGIFLMLALLVRYSLGPAIVVVIEGRSGKDALARSWWLTKDYFWQVFAVMAILMLLVIIASGSLSLPMQALIMYTSVQAPEYAMAAQVAGQVLTSVISLVLNPVWMIAMVLVYYDLRIRKEGFDLMMMADAMGRPAPPPQPVQEHLYPPANGVPAPPPTPPAPPQGGDSPLFGQAPNAPGPTERYQKPPYSPSEGNDTQE